LQPNGSGPASIVEVVAASSPASRGYAVNFEQCYRVPCGAQD
jgi:hypothetical protein